MVKQIELSLNYHQKNPRLICFSDTLLLLCSYISPPDFANSVGPDQWLLQNLNRQVIGTEQFSNSESLSHSDASRQVSAQSNFQFGRRCCLKNFISWIVEWNDFSNSEFLCLQMYREANLMVALTTPMLYIMILSQSFLGSKKEVFRCL